MTRRGKTRQPETSNHPQHIAGLPTLRIAVGLGDPERERSLLSALDPYADITVTDRCLSADELLTAVQGGHVDAVLVAFGLHRLTDARLTALTHHRIPTVLLAADVDDPRWASFPGIVLPPHANAALVHDALLAALRGDRLTVEPQRHDDGRKPVERSAPQEITPNALSVIAIAGGPGSGRTSAAVNLAAALGTVASTILVDLDLLAPSLAVCLDADPTRNLAMLVHAEPETPRDWERAIEQEAQPLHRRSPHADVLCGLPKLEMRSTISPRFTEQLITQLAHRYRYVLADLGTDLLGSDGAVYGAALAGADQILVISTPDLVGLWRTRTFLQIVQHHLQLDSDRVALVLNRYDGRHHHGRGEIEWALEVPVAAVIPRDYRAAERALADQQPLVLNGKSRPASAFLDLAARAHGGQILIPPEETSHTRNGRRWTSWLRWPRTNPVLGKR